MNFFPWHWCKLTNRERRFYLATQDIPIAYHLIPTYIIKTQLIWESKFENLVRLTYEGGVKGTTGTAFKHRHLYFNRDGRRIIDYQRDVATDPWYPVNQTQYNHERSRSDAHWKPNPFACKLECWVHLNQKHRSQLYWGILQIRIGLNHQIVKPARPFAMRRVNPILSPLIVLFAKVKLSIGWYRLFFQGTDWVDSSRSQTCLVTKARRLQW